jgi:formate-nitrite transporter family protein
VRVAAPLMAEEQAEAGTRLSAAQIHRNVLLSGCEELERPAAALLWSSLASGLVIGYSFVGAAYGASLAGEAGKHAAAAAAYPLGFILVILARSELFTENTLVPVIPFLESRDQKTFVNLLRVWGLLLLGNLAGAAIFGWTLARTGMVEPNLHAELQRIAASTTTGSFGHILYAAVFAGWLIALLAWLLAATHATGAQIALIWLCTAPIAALHFRHSIAGAAEAFYRAASGAAGWGEMLTGFVVPAVLGNVIGGVMLVALLNYGQVAAEREGSGAEKKER